jgi:glucosamine 6-phosphate synthetase-like amidotransferase/phosphosugar isomerase protein
MGPPSELSQRLQLVESEALCGIAESRNASRCKASNLTSVPCASNDIALAMSGDIDNFYAVKKQLTCPFPIANDEDMLLALLCSQKDENRLKMISAVDGIVQGDPSYIFTVKGENAVYFKAGVTPLLIGIAQNGTLLSSELAPMLPLAKRYIILKDGERGIITSEKISIFDKSSKRVKPSFQPISGEPVAALEMLPEEELLFAPFAVKNALNSLVKDGSLKKGSFPLSRHSVDKLKRVIFTGCESACNIAELSAAHFKMLTDIPCCAISASELRYSGELFNREVLIIAVCPDGEDEDICLSAERALSFGTKCIAVTLNPLSRLARVCKYTLCPKGDMSTGAYPLREFTALYIALSLLSLSFGRKTDIVSELYLGLCLKMAELLPGCISSSGRSKGGFEYAGRRILSSSKVFITGIGADLALAREAGKCLTQMCCVPCQAVRLSALSSYPAQCLEDAPIIAFITNDSLFTPALRGLRRLRAKGCELMLYTTEALQEEISGFEGILTFPDSLPLFNCLSAMTSIYKTALCAKAIQSGKKEIEPSA